MSKLIRLKNGSGPGRIKSYERIKKKSVPGDNDTIGGGTGQIVNPPPSAELGFVTLSSFFSIPFYFPFIVFDDLFFSGSPAFIVDLLHKTSSQSGFFRYDPRYNSKLGSFDSEGNSVPPSPDYTGEEPLETFQLGFENVRDPETGEDFDAIELYLQYKVDVTLPNPVYDPDYNAGEERPADISDEYDFLFPAFEDYIVNFIKNDAAMAIESQQLRFGFKLSENVTDGKWRQYSFHFDFGGDDYAIYIDNEILEKKLLARVVFPKTIYQDEEHILYGFPSNTSYTIPNLSNSRIFLPRGGGDTSELRIWSINTPQPIINDNAFRRIKYNNAPGLLYYYPLINLTKNDPVRLTELVNGNHGSMGKEGLADPVLWDDDKEEYPPFIRDIPFNLTILAERESEIEIAWSFDERAGTSGFNIYLNDQKDNTTPLAIGSEAGYTLSGLQNNEPYEITITAINEGVESNKSAILAAVIKQPPFVESFDDLDVGTLPVGFEKSEMDLYQPWLITNERANSGRQSLRSAPIEGNQKSIVKYSITLDDVWALTFRYLVSTHFDDHFFKFHIDDSQELSASGQGEWETFQKVLPSGRYELRFEYEKNSTPAENDDACYVDDLGFAVTSIPYNLNLISSGEESVEVSWEYPPNANIDGFHVYVDGQKYNANLLSVGNENGYVIMSLEPDTFYDINASSVDPEGVESDLSETLTVKTRSSLQTIFEDFESYEVGFTPPEFAKPEEADAPWVVTDVVAYSGVKSLASGAITDGQTAAFIYTVNLAEQSALKFQYLVSTEEDYDFLYVYINDVEELAASGETEWGLFEKALPAGTHTVRFDFVKDGSASDGDDRVYIDDFGIEALPVLPPTGLEVILQDTTYNLTWDANTEPDVAGYNVYVDGQKFNTDLIPDNGFQVDGIDLEASHTFEVTAVNTDSFESGKSNTQTTYPGLQANPPAGYSKAFIARTPVSEDSDSEHTYSSGGWSVFLEFPIGNVENTFADFNDAYAEQMNIYITTDTGLEIQITADPDIEDPYITIDHDISYGSCIFGIQDYIPETETRPYFPKLQELAQQTADGTIGILELWVEKTAITTIDPY